MEVKTRDDDKSVATTSEKAVIEPIVVPNSTWMPASPTNTPYSNGMPIRRDMTKPVPVSWPIR
jgi:hypothetical protein